MIYVKYFLPNPGPCAGSHRASSAPLTGYEGYKPLHTSILGRGRGRQYY